MARSSDFFLATGFRQIHLVFEEIARVLQFVATNTYFGNHQIHHIVRSTSLEKSSRSALSPSTTDHGFFHG
jgi:hypothetical protein